MELRLSDADRARYGGDEWLPWDSSRLTVSEATLLQELPDLGISVAKYRASWLASHEPQAFRWGLWLALRRSGVDVPWGDFDPDLLGASLRVDPEPEGKDPSSTPPSPSGDGGSNTPPP
jgi:hypothetical protein